MKDEVRAYGVCLIRKRCMALTLRQAHGKFFGGDVPRVDDVERPSFGGRRRRRRITKTLRVGQDGLLEVEERYALDEAVTLTDGATT